MLFRRCLLVCLAIVLLGLSVTPAPAQPRTIPNTQVWLPQILGKPNLPRFGAQILDWPGIDQRTTQAATDLKLGWVRLGIVSWKAAEPVEGGGYNWAALEPLDSTLRTLLAANIKVEIVVADSPTWATVNVPFVTSCGAIRADKFASFGRFMVALVNRYSQPEFGVQDWELGNEVDVDPGLVGPDNGFGCWGNIKDPYYGGQHYGEMLKVVTPMIRASGRPARIWHGGLLLASPESPPEFGKPELFLAGVLTAGGGPYFDVLPLHAYPSYSGSVIDPRDNPYAQWRTQGGFTVGKIRYIRSLMQQYAVDKPLVMNEFAMICTTSVYAPSLCNPIDAAFYQMQANHLVRDAVRALDAGVESVYWYKVGQPDWRGSSLLGPNGERTPSFTSFQQLIQLLNYSAPLGAVDYGTGREAYAFTANDQRVEVVWAEKDEQLPIQVPHGSVQAYTRDGVPITPSEYGNTDYFFVGFEPIYLIFR